MGKLESIFNSVELYSNCGTLQGDLKQFLIATQKGGTTELTIPQCVAVIHQLAKGMEHLSNNRLVHKDLAARNCLITSALGAKISMPRLIKEPYSQEYCKHLNQVIL